MLITEEKFCPNLEIEGLASKCLLSYIFIYVFFQWVLRDLLSCLDTLKPLEPLNYLEHLALLDNLNLLECMNYLGHLKCLDCQNLQELPVQLDLQDQERF